MVDEHPKCLANFQTNKNKTSHADFQAHSHLHACPFSRPGRSCGSLGSLGARFLATWTSCFLTASCSEGFPSRRASPLNNLFEIKTGKGYVGRDWDPELQHGWPWRMPCLTPFARHGTLAKDLDSGKTALSLNSCLPFLSHEILGESHSFSELHFPHVYRWEDY